MNLWDTPPFAAHAAPVLWTPNMDTGERFVALVLIRYDSPTSGDVRAPIVFHSKQLKAMVGTRRAVSALGILEHVSAYMRQQMLAGTALEGVSAPFDGFSVGRPVRVRGYSAKQVVDTAIRTLSAFGSRDAYDDDDEANHRNSVPTRQFLRSVRSLFAREDDDRKARFNRTVAWPDSAEMTIDYAHEKHLVQVTSLPQSAMHLISLQKEAESKLFELDITASLLRSDRSPAQPSLLINTASLVNAETGDARRTATELLERLKFMTSQKQVTLFQASNPIEASEMLEELELSAGLTSA
jgi:hypothetical protein